MSQISCPNFNETNENNFISSQQTGTNTIKKALRNK